MKVFKHTGAVVLGLSTLMLSGSALAVPVTVAGATVSFTFDSDLAGYFGAPTIVGDTVSFTPTTFKAHSFNGSGFASSSQTFNISVTANSGYLLSAVNLTEDGDYWKIGAGAAVAVGGKLYVRDMEAPLAPAASSSILATLPLSGATSMENFETTNWTASAGVAIPAGWGGADGIVSGANVTIQNILLANTRGIDSAAFIEKKFAGLSIITSSLHSPLGVAAAIPEPQTYALFFAGLGLVGFMARRRVRLGV